MDPVAWLQQSEWHFNSFLLMVVLLWSQVGFSMVLLSAAVKGVPGDTLEAARIDGASERQIFFKVVVPQIKGTIITVYITVLIGVMKVFDIVYVMTNGNFNTNVLGNEFWNQLSTNFNNGAAAAIVVILMIAVIPIMCLPGAALQGRGGQRMTFPATTVIDDTPKVSQRKAPRTGARATPPRPAGQPRSSSRCSASGGWCRSSAPS